MSDDTITDATTINEALRDTTDARQSSDTLAAFEARWGYRLEDETAAQREARLSPTTSDGAFVVPQPWVHVWDPVDAHGRLGEPVVAVTPPVFNAVLESAGGGRNDAFIPNLEPRQRTFLHEGHDYYHIDDAPDGRWIYRERA